MDGPRFDALTRKLATATAARASRRVLLKAGSLAGVASLVQQRPTTAQEATSSPARPSSRPSGGPTPAQLAFDLEYDPERIFAFVRDEVRYDPYPGILRGAKGTLWGLAGNAADQAVLLAALLTEALVESRFVIGTLDDSAVARLTEAATWDEETVREHARKVLDVTNPGGEAIIPPEPTGEQREQAEQLVEDGVRAFEAARGQIDQTVDTLHDALDGAGIALPILRGGIPERERTQHVWVQYRAGAEWVDLDPVFPDAEAGDAIAADAAPLAELPPELFHGVTVRAVAEVIQGGQAVERELLAYTARAADLVGEALTFLHLGPPLFKAVGVSIEGLLEGSTQFVPTLLVPGDGQAGVALTFGTGGGGVFGSIDSDEGQAVAEWLEVEVAPVDRPVRTARREVFDRIGFERRAAGTVNLAELRPVELTDLGEGQKGYLPLEAVTRIVIGGAGVPGGYFVQDYTVADPVADMANSLYGQRYTRAALALDRMTETGVRLYADAPSVSSITLAPMSVTPDRAEGQVVVDLIHQGLATAPTGSVTLSQHPGILAGVLDHTAERLVLEAGQQVSGQGGPPSASVGRLFEAALAERVPLVTMAPGATIERGLELSERARARIAAALADGYAVVVPSRAIDLGGGPLTGWWQIDPTTGETVDRLETGQGAASLRAPLGEQVVTIQVGTRSVYAFRIMSLCIVIVFQGALVMFGAGLVTGVAGSRSSIGAGAVIAGGTAGLAAGLGLVAGGLACAG